MKSNRPSKLSLLKSLRFWGLLVLLLAFFFPKNHQLNVAGLALSLFGFYIVIESIKGFRSGTCEVRNDFEDKVYKGRVARLLNIVYLVIGTLVFLLPGLGFFLGIEL